MKDCGGSSGVVKYFVNMVSRLLRQNTEQLPKEFTFQTSIRSVYIYSIASAHPSIIARHASNLSPLRPAHPDSRVSNSIILHPTLQHNHTQTKNSTSKLHTHIPTRTRRHPLFPALQTPPPRRPLKRGTQPHLQTKIPTKPHRQPGNRNARRRRHNTPTHQSSL